MCCDLGKPNDFDKLMQIATPHAVATRHSTFASSRSFKIAASPREVCIHRQCKMKRYAVGRVCGGPQSTPMGFHDRTADRKPHTHAAGFGGEEGIEHTVHILSGYPDAAIGHAYNYLSLLIQPRSDRQLARPTGN